MKQKKIIGIIFVIALFCVSASYFFASPTVCDDYPLACSQVFLQVRSLAFILFLPLLFISIILFFVHRKTFLAWAKFAVPAFPIMLGILLYTYNNARTVGGGIGVIPEITDEMFASATLPLFFALISLGIIFLKSAEFSIGLNSYIRLTMKYFGLAMIILPILLALSFFIWWFTVVVL